MSGATTIRLLAAVLSVINCSTTAAGSPDWSGYLSIEPRIFFEEPLFSEQPGAGLSPALVAAPEMRLEWNDGDDRLTLSPFIRLDADDDNRSDWDLREASWLHQAGPWTWYAGIGHVFWGVSESRHLIDIVNQTDWVDDVDEEAKLGQPMIQAERWTENAGTFSVFLLPGFRERTFPAADARLRGTLPVDVDSAEYESAAGRHRVDWAVRWSYTTGNWDVGVSGFNGTSREPNLIPRIDSDPGPVLVPRYTVISQLGTDIQYTKDAWLWKLEALGRSGQGKTFLAYIAGFEYTAFNLADSGADLGVLVEYLYDGRDTSAPPTIYDDDWFAGIRLALNDTQDTMLLAGAIVESKGTFAVLEAERRLGESWKLELEVRLFSHIDPADLLLTGFRNDSFATIRLAKYL